MAERRLIKKKLEQDILTVRCPCCNELIPVRIAIEGHGVDENYVTIGGSTIKAGSPFPDVKLGLDVDIMGLKFQGGLDEIMENMSDTEKKMYRESYDYDRLDGIYGEKAREEAKKEAEDLANVQKREKDANRSD